MSTWYNDIVSKTKANISMLMPGTRSDDELPSPPATELPPVVYRHPQVTTRKLQWPPETESKLYWPPIVPTQGPSSSPSAPSGLSMQQVSEARRRQEEVLEDMSVILDRLGVASEKIGTELEEHNQLAVEILEEVDIADDKVTVANSKMEKLLNSGNSCWKYMCIIFLTLLMIVLLMLIIYT